MYVHHSANFFSCGPCLFLEIHDILWLLKNPTSFAKNNHDMIRQSDSSHTSCLVQKGHIFHEFSLLTALRLPKTSVGLSLYEYMVGKGKGRKKSVSGCFWHVFWHVFQSCSQVTTNCSHSALAQTNHEAMGWWNTWSFKRRGKIQVFPVCRSEPFTKSRSLECTFCCQHHQWYTENFLMMSRPWSFCTLQLEAGVIHARWNWRTEIIQYSTVQYDTIRYATIQYDTYGTYGTCCKTKEPKNHGWTVPISWYQRLSELR